MDNHKGAIIGVFSALIGIALTLVIVYLVLPMMQQREVVVNAPSDTMVVQDDGEPNDTEQPAITQNTESEIIYLQDGDVWRSDAKGEERIKLVDLDTVQKARKSPSGQFIAYTYGVESTDEVTESDGETNLQTFTKYPLMISDSRGTTGKEVAPAVNRWGWVPGSDLIWYEDAELQVYFGYGYYGNSNVKLYDPKTEAVTELVDAIDTQDTLNIQWSLSGDYVAYYDLRFGNSIVNTTLVVVDRRSGETMATMDIPYVGGDRGGPPPVPMYEWSESDDIYLAFNPIWFSDEEKASGFADQFNLGHAHFYKLDVKAGSSELLNNDYYAPIMNDEMMPKPVFVDNYSKVIFAATKETAENPTDFYNQFETDYVLLDFATGDLTVIGDLDGFGLKGDALSGDHKGKNTAFAKGENGVIYFSQFADNNVQINLINTKSGAVTQVDELLSNDFKRVNAPVTSGAESLWFLFGDELFVLNDTAQQVLTGITDFQVIN